MTCMQLHVCFPIVDRFAFLETNPADGRKIISLSKEIKIGRQTIIFDESRKPSYETGQATTLAAESMPRRTLLPLPEPNGTFVF